ncbi:hypothetical protein [Patulibacter americanus]|uniref:hypothetical protein n=1 Tax=Patulibacter americanus TaxID=588672 RepID=UPI0003B5CF99|nr:hypothetical protein [Patulibacter americanus]
MPTGDPDGRALDALDAGMAHLAPVLLPHGFRPRPPHGGASSGGAFAAASFVRAERRLDLSIRGGSLTVGYHVAGDELGHAAYMRALLGPAGTNAFPAYAHDLAGAFEALRHDLELHATDFVSGDGAEFRRCCVVARAAEGRSGFARLGDAARDLRGS